METSTSLADGKSLIGLLCRIKAWSGKNQCSASKLSLVAASLPLAKGFSWQVPAISEHPLRQASQTLHPNPMTATPKKEIKAHITISRPQCSDGRECITMIITDATSRITLANLNLTFVQFAEAITGAVVSDISCVTCAVDDRIGKERTLTPRKILAPASLPYGKEKEWLEENYPEKPQPIYFRDSRGSVRKCTDGIVINYSTITWE
jgi:hypothetical protein